MQGEKCSHEAELANQEKHEGKSTMKRFAAFAAAAVLWGVGTVAAQEVVHFPSLEDNGPGPPATVLDGYLFRPAGEGRHPAIVGLHGCSGMFGRDSGQIRQIYRQWAAEFIRHGYAFLLVDSLGPRRHGEMCSVGGFDLGLYRQRPKDAYGALLYLQAQPFVQGDRIAVIGWSQGGATVLNSIGVQSLGRPAQLPQGDFRAAVAFYPGACNDRRQPPDWTTRVPLLALMGAEDVWTPAAPCQAFLAGATGRGAPIESIVYPGVYHSFDSPDQPRRELPDFRTREGVVPIVATDPAARQDALARVPAFLARFIDTPR
jgi:dienelactone hydrolase